jgi:hypothetical protein
MYLSVGRFDPLSSAMNTIHDEIKSRLNEKSEGLVESVFSRFAHEERVDRPEKVDAYLMKVFDERGISQNFEFGIYNNKNELVMATIGMMLNQRITKISNESYFPTTYTEPPILCRCISKTTQLYHGVDWKW